MDFFWGLIALVVAAIVIVAVVATLVRRLRWHRRDVRIVDMHNRGCSVSQIAEALDSTDEEVRKAMKRISGSMGSKTGG
jgi:hypothetical protein